ETIMCGLEAGPRGLGLSWRSTCQAVGNVANRKAQIRPPPAAVPWREPRIRETVKETALSFTVWNAPRVPRYCPGSIMRFGNWHRQIFLDSGILFRFKDS